MDKGGGMKKKMKIEVKDRRGGGGWRDESSRRCRN